MDSLPEEIRAHILSLMPTKFAAQTSILSKSWRYTWTLVTNLEFHFDDEYYTRTPEDLDTLTKCVFNSFKTSKLNLFRLHFGFHLMHNLPNCTDEAVKLNVRELDIRINCPNDHLPLSMFTCATLTTLRFDHTDIVWECPSRASLPCLKTLDIIVYSNPFVNAFKLIPACPVLESLSLQVDYCQGQQHYVFRIPTLKRLKLKISRKLPVFHKVILRLPVLEYLCVAGRLNSLFVMEDLPALVEASILTRSTSGSHLWWQLLKGVSGVESLLIRNMTHHVPLPVFPNTKRLQLNVFWDQGEIPQFLEHCPELKHLCLGMKFAFCLWVEPKVVPGCIRTKLTTLKYLLVKETMSYDMEVLKYLLGNAEVLKTVTIAFEQSLNLEEEEMRLYAELLKFPRASMGCAIKRDSSWCALLK